MLDFQIQHEIFTRHPLCTCLHKSAKNITLSVPSHRKASYDLKRLSLFKSNDLLPPYPKANLAIPKH